MKQKTFQTTLLCMVLLLVSGVFAQTPITNTKYALSVQQTVDFGAKNNVQVKNALLNLQIQQQTNRGITAAALPNLSANGSFTDYINIPTSLLPGEFFGQPAGTYIPVKFGTKYNASSSVKLEQLLFDGQIFIGLKARKTTIDFQTKNIEVTEEAIKANIYKVYYQLVASKTQITLIDANLARLAKLQHDATELYKNGFAEKLDIDKITVQIANLKTQKISVVNNIAIGYLGLKTLIGMPVKDTLTLTDTLSDAKIKEGILQDAPYQYEDRKDYQYAQLGKKLGEFNIRRYKLAYLPTLSASGVYSKQAQRTDFSFFKGGDWYTTSFVGLNLNVPIFSGFAKDAKVKQSMLELKQTENNIENLQRIIDNDVSTALLNFNAAVSTMDYQKQNMVLAETVYNQTKKKFEIGTGSNTEITSAQTDLITAETNYINALYSAIIAKVDYQKAIGKL